MFLLFRDSGAQLEICVSFGLPVMSEQSHVLRWIAKNWWQETSAFLPPQHLSQPEIHSSERSEPGCWSDEVFVSRLLKENASGENCTINLGVPPQESVRPHLVAGEIETAGSV